MNNIRCAFYLLSAFVTLFFNGASIACAQESESINEWVKGKAYHISYDFEQFGLPNPAIRTIAGFDIISPNVSDQDFKSLAQLKPTLYHLSFNQSKITDLGIRYISTIQSLQALGVSSQATDDACSSIKNLKNLRWLSLSETNITDQCLIAILKLNNLITLSINKTKINGSGFSNVNSNLTRLNANGAQINDEGLKQISNVKKINSLHLSKTKITNHGIRYLKNLSNLSDLNIGYNKNITDAGVAELVLLSSQLIDLQMDSLDITDISVKVLSKLTSLKQLHIVATKITPQGLAKLKKALPDTEIRY